MSCPPQLWDGVLRRLGAELPAFALEAWLRPLVAEPDERGIRLLCPSAFHRDRVRERFMGGIARAAEAEAGHSVRIELDVRKPPRGTAPVTATAPTAASERRASPASAAAPTPVPAPVRQAPLPYTFENFVVGPCNALAREASLAVARGRQRRVNPLYLSAATGLGKTHLARAIVAESRTHGGARVLYASAESFTNEFMTSIRSKRTDVFKRRFREECDLLVVEDVQFLRAKKATQLELFHTLVHLHDTGARVELTGDRLPLEIDGLESRLRSQMAAGMVAELEPPDARVRREILRRKAASGGVRVPDECLDLLVETVRGSVRDLEGVLIQLVATASLLKRPIDLELTGAALRKVDPGRAGALRLEPRQITEVVARYFDTTPEALASRSRRRDVLVPRQLAMFLCRRYTDAPLSSIARIFGRDHPAVSNAVKAVERRILERAPLRYQLEALTARLQDLQKRR